MARIRKCRLRLGSSEGAFGIDALSPSWYFSLTLVVSAVGWQELVGPVLEMYKDHTNGSEIKIAKNSVSWNFSHADPELGAMQADQLQNELEEILGRTMPQAQVARKLGRHGLNEVWVTRNLARPRRTHRRGSSAAQAAYAPPCSR